MRPSITGGVEALFAKLWLFAGNTALASPELEDELELEDEELLLDEELELDEEDDEEELDELLEELLLEEDELLVVPPPFCPPQAESINPRLANPTIFKQIFGNLISEKFRIMVNSISESQHKWRQAHISTHSPQTCGIVRESARELAQPSRKLKHQLLEIMIFC